MAPSMRSCSPLMGGSSNVDQVLTRIRNAKSRRNPSGFKHLILFMILVAGTGFEPVTFRL